MLFLLLLSRWIIPRPPSHITLCSRLTSPGSTASPWPSVPSSCASLSATKRNISTPSPPLRAVGCLHRGLRLRPSHPFPHCGHPLSAAQVLLRVLLLLAQKQANRVHDHRPLVAQGLGAALHFACHVSSAFEMVVFGFRANKK
jgi:hypothetical protein